MGRHEEDPKTSARRRLYVGLPHSRAITFQITSEMIQEQIFCNVSLVFLGQLFSAYAALCILRSKQICGRSSQQQLCGLIYFIKLLVEGDMLEVLEGTGSDHVSCLKFSKNKF